jgi:hypothetical protein
VTGFDILWPSDESLEASGNLPDPDVLAQEIVETSKSPSNHSAKSPRIYVLTKNAKDQGSNLDLCMYAK